MIRPFHHLYTITLSIVLNFVHDVVDEENAAARGAKEIGRVTRIGNLLDIKSLAFVFNRKTRFFRRQFRRDFQQLGRVVFIAVLDRVYKRFVERDEKVRAFRPNQTKLCDPLLQVLKHAIHQRQITRKFKLDLFVNVWDDAGIVNVMKFVGERLFDDFAQHLAVVRHPQVVCRAHLERPDLLVVKVADYQIEAFKIVAPQRLLALNGYHDFVPEALESLFKNSQLIVIIDDENPALFHQAPILTSITRRDFDWLYENVSPVVRNISEVMDRITGFTRDRRSC